MTTPPSDEPRELVTRAEYERRLKRARRWWWAGILFFGGGAASAAGIAITQRQQLDPSGMGGMLLVMLFGLERLFFVLRRRPH